MQVKGKDTAVGGGRRTKPFRVKRATSRVRNLGSKGRQSLEGCCGEGGWGIA